MDGESFDPFEEGSGDDMALKATFELEQSELQLGNGPIAGVDEAGRGPWAGPVVAAAVILDPDNIPPGIADSKALDAEAREALYPRIMATARVGVGIADVARIDRDNILNATMWAMTIAVKALPGGKAERPKLVLVDGNRAPRFACRARTIVKGDARSLSIAAASIIAKVTRDRMMIALGRSFPGYGFERHKGYGTPEHADALARLGVTEHHRRSFRPVQLALGLVTDGGTEALSLSADAPQGAA
ncbi:MAG: ribonuclease HII [Hyphomicrobiaceae bacterium]